MILKHLAANFNINAILNKSAPERKTFLDRMLEKKKETERLLEKFNGFASQEHINNLTEKLLVLDTKIDQFKKSLSPEIIYDPMQILKMLGLVYNTQFEDGTKTSFVAVTAEGLASLLGEDEILNIINNNGTIIRSGNTNRTYDNYSEEHDKGIIKNGFIVDLDLIQQVNLLSAIERKSEFNRIGFYNVNGGSVLNIASPLSLWDRGLIGLFWTGEQYKNSLDKNEYSNAGLVFSNDAKFRTALLKREAFCARDTSFEKFSYHNSNYHDSSVFFVLGMINYNNE